jgi:hypothetical protein
MRHWSKIALPNLFGTLSSDKHSDYASYLSFTKSKGLILVTEDERLIDKLKKILANENSIHYLKNR